MRIIISFVYGEYLTLARKLSDDLAAEGHQIFLDSEGLRTGPDWVHQMEDAIDWASGKNDGSDLTFIGTDEGTKSDSDPPGRLLLLMSEKTIGRTSPSGASLDLLAKILNRKVPVIPAMILLSEPPLTIFRIQWLDMQHLNQPDDENERYQQILGQLTNAITSKEPDHGSNTYLFNTLNPITFEINIAENIGKFIGRKWLIENIDGWMQDPNGKKVCWIQGGPGIGKTALAIWYSNYRVLSAFYLFQYDSNQTTDPRKFVQTLAYQLSTQFPAYRHRLEQIHPESKENLSGPDLLNELILNAFHHIGKPDHPVVILLDGLDEIFLQAGMNTIPKEMVQTIRALYKRTETMPWFRFIFSSRDNQAVETELQLDAVDRLVIDPTDMRNQEDIRKYLERELSDISGESIAKEKIDDILTKSQGFFIYVSFFCIAVKKNIFSLDDPSFPADLSDAYLQFFKRQFPDISDYKSQIAPSLRVICAAREALPLEILAGITGLDEEDENEFEILVTSLFPVDNKTIRPFHTTVIEWISDTEKSGRYFVSLKKGHEVLADYGYHQVMIGDVSDYLIRNLPYHLLEVRDEKRLADVMKNPEFVVKAYNLDQFALQRLWVRIENETSLRMEEVYGTPLDELLVLPMDFLNHVGILLYNMSRLSSALTWYQALEQSSRNTNDLDYLYISLGNQALILNDRGDLDGAMALLKEQERICRELGNVDGLQASLGNQASILRTRGDLDGAMALYKEQERICRELGNVDSLQRTFGNQANILSDRGDLDGAMTLYKEKERICRELGNVNGLQYSLGNQALILRTRGDLDGAMALLKEQERICRELGNVDSLQRTFGNQANILSDRGDLDGAMALLKEQERICRELGNVDSLQRTFGNQANILSDRGDLDGAMALLKEQERICRELGNVDSLQRSLGNQANILSDRGDLDGAMTLYKEKERICRELGNVDSLQRSLGNQALILKSRGDLDGAMALHKEEERICRELGNVDGLQASLGNQANILSARGDPDGAMALYKEQEQICMEQGILDGLQISLGNQALILQDHGDLDGAMALYKEKERICRELGDVDGLQASLGNQANILSARGDPDGAMALHKEQERICRELGNVDSLQRTLGNQGTILYNRGDLDGAMALYKEQEQICMEQGNLDGLQISLGNQALILQDHGDLDGAMALVKEQKRICRELGDVDSLQASLGNQGTILYNRGDLDGAMALYKEQEQICMEQGNLDGLQISLGNQALILQDHGDLDGAMALVKEQKRICRELGDVDSLQASLGNQGTILYNRGDLDGAMALYKEQEQICMEQGNLNGLQISLGNQALILQDHGDMDGAMALLKEQKRICREIGNVESLARSLTNQALILKHKGELSQADTLLREAFDLAAGHGYAILAKQIQNIMTQPEEKSD